MLLGSIHLREPKGLGMHLSKAGPWGARDSEIPRRKAARPPCPKRTAGTVLLSVPSKGLKSAIRLKRFLL